jgi:hypothetical protein
MKTVNISTYGEVGKHVADADFDVNDLLFRIQQWQEFKLNIYQILNVTYKHKPFMVIQDIS